MLQDSTSGINPNPFFATPEIKKPLISDSTRIKPLILKPTFLYDLSTQAGGIYTIVKTKGDAGSNNSLLESYTLEQNYPNPFNSGTNITFGMTESAKISLKIYDILGREIAILVDKNLEADDYTVTWDAKNSDGSKAASGIYFYILIAGNGNHIITKKMLLIK